MRGRNRRGPNPLTRSYDSNGPDVKVRGTAQHVAEKYTQLARDAHVSGDPVMAENYLQHAEHYYRLIAAAYQAQQAIQNGTADDRDDDEDDFDTASDRFTFRPAQPQMQVNGPQNFGADRTQSDVGESGEPGEAGDDQPVVDRPFPERNQHRPNERQPHRNDRHGGRDRSQDRGFRHGQDRGFNDRGGHDRSNHDRANQDRPNQDRPNQDRGGFNPGRPRRPTPDLEGAEQPVLPAFLTAPVRAVPIDVPASPAPVPAGVIAETEEQMSEATRSPFRTRRRRRRAGREGGDDGAFEPEASGTETT